MQVSANWDHLILPRGNLGIAGHCKIRIGATYRYQYYTLVILASYQAKNIVLVIYYMFMQVLGSYL